MSLSDLRDAWLADQRLRNREGTVTSARNRAILGRGKYVDEITSADLARLIERRRADRVSDLTINGHLTLIRAMLRWGVAEGLIRELPVRVCPLRPGAAPSRSALNGLFRIRSVLQPLLAAFGRTSDYLDSESRP